MGWMAGLVRGKYGKRAFVYFQSNFYDQYYVINQVYDRKSKYSTYASLV